MTRYSDVSKTNNCLTVFKLCFCIFAIIIFSKAFLFHVFTDVNQGRSVSIDLQTEGPIIANKPHLLFLYGSIYCITALLVLINFKTAVRSLLREKYVVLLLALSALSAIWSMVPGLTLARSAALGGTALFGIYWAMTFSLSQQLKMIGVAFYIIIFASFVLSVLYPQIATMQGYQQGIWQGAFAHKNHLGKAMPIGSIVFFLLAAKESYRSYLYWPGFFLGVVLLVMSCSKSSYLSYIILFTILSVYLVAKHKYKLSVVAFVSVLIVSGSLVSIVKYSIFPPVLASQIMAAEHESFCDVFSSTIAVAPPSSNSTDIRSGTGRKLLWEHLVSKFKLKPWLGYGYGGYWFGENSQSEKSTSDLRSAARHAHNGYLDLVLDLGLLGLTLFFAGYLVTLRKSLKIIDSNYFDPLTLYHPLILAYALLASVGESELLAPNSIIWVLLVSAFFYNARSLSE